MKPTENIKSILKERGLTQQDLADSLCVSLQNVRQLLNKDSITTTTLERIASALNVPVWQLLISKEELNSVDREQPFVALVRDGAQLHSFNSKADLKRYAETL